MRFAHIYKVAAVGLRGAMWTAVLAGVLGIGGCRAPYDSELLRAGQLVRAGKCEAAVAVFEQTLPLVPADAKRERASALVGYGDCLTAQGKLREAYTSYQSAWEADAENLDAHLRLSQFLANGDQPVRAAEHAEFVLRRRPDDATAMGVLGGIEAEAGHAERAKMLLQRALESFGANDAQR